MINRCRTQISQRLKIVARRVGHQIGSQLQLNELIVRNIFIDSFNHPVTISPGERVGRIGGFRCGIVFPVASDIQPVASPAFPIALRRQQTVDQLGISGWILVSDECLNFIVGRTQPSQIKRGTVDESSKVGLRGRSQLLLLQLCEDEPIDLFFGPTFGEQGVADFGLRLRCYRLEGPPFATAFNIHAFLGCCRSGNFGSFRTRVRSPCGDPFFECGNFVVGQLARRGHAKFRLVVSERFE